MTSAWQYAAIGPLTLSPAAQSASSDTVIFWSDKVVLTTTQVTIPATAMMIPTTMEVIEATLRMALAPFRRLPRPAPSQQVALSVLRWRHLTTVPKVPFHALMMRRLSISRHISTAGRGGSAAQGHLARETWSTTPRPGTTEGVSPALPGTEGRDC